MKTILLRISTLWIIWILLATLLGWTGMFFSHTLWILLLIMIAWFLWNNDWKSYRLPKVFTSPSFLISLAFFCFILINTFFFFQPQTLFTGRDQGSISQATHFLVQHHSFKFLLPEGYTFFRAYGEGQALNFPGFFYTKNAELTTQFPHPTIAWYGSLLALGIPSPYHIVFANTITLSLFAFAFFSLLTLFTSKRVAFLFTALALFSFPLWWFSRFSLTENLMLALLWVTLVLFVQTIRRPSPSSLFALTLSLLLLFATRIEGMAFLPLFLISLFFFPPCRAFLLAKPWMRIVFPLTVITGFSVLTILNNLPFYTTVTKAILTTLGIFERPETTETLNTLSLSALWGSLFLYGMGILFLLALVAVIFLIRNKAFSKLSLAIILILSPSLIYLFLPFISPDQPWMFRRLMFATVPLSIFLIALGWHKLRSSSLLPHHTFFVLTGVLFITAYIPFFVFFFETEDTALLQETRVLARNFSPDDLVLIDPDVTGDGFSMMPGVLRLEGIPSAYFFNPTDFIRADFDPFEDVYLIVPEDKVDQYDLLMDNKGLPLTFTAEYWTQPPSPFSFPTLTTRETNNLIFHIF